MPVISIVLFSLCGLLVIALVYCLWKLDLPGHFRAMDCIRSDHRLGICDYCEWRRHRD